MVDPLLPVYLGPEDSPLIKNAILSAGGRLVPLAEAEAAVWTSLDPTSWRNAGPHSQLRWVQLLLAGVESWIDAGVLDSGETWTSARGASAHTVAEHALALLLAVRHRFTECARSSSWHPEIDGIPLRGATALIVGCGAIGRALIPMLASLEVETIAITRTGHAVAGAKESYDPSALGSLWGRADVVILAAPATPSTRNIIDRKALKAMPNHSTLINVARGTLVDTDALVDALQSGEIAGAGLDVTAPEPLPAGHPLWELPSVLITPHDANPPVAWKANVAQRVVENMRRYAAREELLGTIDLHRSY